MHKSYGSFAVLENFCREPFGFLMSADLAAAVILTTYVFEFVTSILCLILNAYFIVRFSSMSKFSPNLRIVLASTHTVTTIVNFLHPIVETVPPNWYSLQSELPDGQYNNSIAVNYLQNITLNGGAKTRVFSHAFYFGLFLMHICIYILDSKFLMIGIERFLAFRDRAQYENRGALLGIQIVIISTIICTVTVLVKTYLIFCLYPNASLDDKLQMSFNIDRWSGGYMSALIIASSCWFFGFLVFTYLRRWTHDHWYKCATLSESFQIRQVAAMTEVLRPIIAAYGVLCLVCAPACVSYSYWRFVLEYPITDPRCSVSLNIIYVAAGSYNVFSTAYLIWYIEPLRTRFAKDVDKFLGIQINRPTVVVSPQPACVEIDEHFKYLKSHWA